MKRDGDTKTYVLLALVSLTLLLTSIIGVREHVVDAQLSRQNKDQDKEITALKVDVRMQVDEIAKLRAELAAKP